MRIEYPKTVTRTWNSRGAEVAVGTSRPPATTERMPTARAAENVGPTRRFSRRCPLGFLAPFQTSQLMRTRGIQDGGGEANHERISVPGVVVFSQLRLTSCTHCESAWRTENTGLSRVARGQRKFVRLYAARASPAIRNAR